MEHKPTRTEVVQLKFIYWNLGCGSASLFRNNSTICAFSFTGTDIVTYYFIIFITLISLGLSRATGGLLM
jgi:hypothetical protein